MAACTHNHVQYDARLNFIKETLKEKLFDLEKTNIEPIQYDPECPFKYNNFVYRVVLPADWQARNTNCSPQKQPGLVTIPSGTHEFILRLNNPDAKGMACETRIENEVAIPHLAQDALRHLQPAVVPRIFGWGSSAAGAQGWILQELMHGSPVDEAFPTMTLNQKRAILSQMATMLDALQKYPLPETVTGWGGLTFDSNGYIISAPMTSVDAGPWSTLEDSFRARLRIALSKADKNPYITGWRADGVRDRIEAFVENGLSAQFSTLGSHVDRAIIHADFTTNNLLYDPSSGSITALLDYDFSCILHPIYEYLRSFDGSGGQFRGWSGKEGSEDIVLRNAKLTGVFPSPLPPTGDSGI